MEGNMKEGKKGRKRNVRTNGKRGRRKRGMAV
jgi:hypothetical protein